MALRSTDDTTNGHRPPGRPTVAAFDFDGTLTDGGSVFPFLVSLRGLLPVLRATLRLSPALLRAAITGGTAADEVKEKLFTACSVASPSTEVDRRSAVFAHRHLQRHLRDDTRRRLEWHRVRGTTPSSCRPHPSATSARPARSSASTASWRPGSPSAAGASSPAATRGRTAAGAEKYARLVVHLRARGLLSNNGGEQPVLWAYGNSRGDLRLLNAADHGVDAGRLGPLGPPAPVPPALRGWRARQPGVAAIPTTWPE